MAYYFSYDALIPNYKEEDGFYTKEELHCTLAYSKKDISDDGLTNVKSLQIPIEQEVIVTKIDIFNGHIVLLIDNPNLMETNKKLLNEFSITEDHDERKMHVSIKKGLGNNSVDLKDLENEYIGKKIILHSPKLFLKDVITKEKTIISLQPKNNKLKL